MISRLGLGQVRTSSPLLNLLYLDPIFAALGRPDLFNLMIFVDDLALWTKLLTNCVSFICA